MYFLELLLATGISFIFLFIVFYPMERTFSAKKEQAVFRPHWFTDLCYFLGQYLIWNSLLLFVYYYFRTWLNAILPLEFRTSVAAQPFWLQIVEVVVLSDVLIYWGHRIQHKVGFLWRFHKVHHSAEHLDWLAAHREHPLDTIYTVTIINLPAFILGFPLSTIVGLIAFRGIWAIYIHSNVRFSIGPLRKLIGAPELHHWHHDLNRDAGNYANISPLMDIIFGTYTCPDHEPEKVGIKEHFPKSYVAQLLHPILPDSINSKIWPKNSVESKSGE